MKTILVATDFSKTAHNACKYAIAIAKHFKARIILLHAYETPILYSDAPFVTMQMDMAIVRSAEAARLKKYYRKIAPLAKGIQMDMILQQGLPSIRISEIALEKKADLIIIGTTGKGSVERVFVGSNATRVIRNAPCLVLAIPAKAKFSGMKKIVYATDMMDENFEHAKGILPFAKSFNASVDFLHVDTGLMFDEKKDMEKLKMRVKNYMHYPKVSAHVFNDPNISDGIGFFLKKNKADCIAMYTHHRSAINIFSSSQTKATSFLTKIPLLVIHEKDYMEDLSARKRR